MACAILALPTAALADSARSSQYAGGGTARDFDCNDFSSQNDAQRVLNSDTSDPFNLDADNDGDACERNRFVSVGLARTGLDAFTLALIGGLCVLGGLGLRRWRAPA